MAEDKEVDYEEVLEIMGNLREGGIRERNIPNVAANLYAISHVDGYREMNEEERKAVRDKIIAGLDEYKEQKKREEEDARNKPFKDVYDDIKKKVEEDGMTLEEAKEVAKGEYFADHHILDDEKQKEWEKNFEAYYKNRKAREDEEARAEMDKRDEQIEQMLKDIDARMKAGMGVTDYNEVKEEVLNEHFTKNKITDPKEQEAWRKDFDTYQTRKAEKEKAAAEAHKKSGRKILGNGVVSKWLSRNKDKLVLATTATLGAAWTASASLSAAGMGGLGLLPTIQVLGVSSTVFPPVLAAGALLVAGIYVKKMLDARKAEKEAEKGKTGEKSKGSFLDRLKRGGRS